MRSQIRENARPIVSSDEMNEDLRGELFLSEEVLLSLQLFFVFQRRVRKPINPRIPVSSQAIFPMKRSWESLGIGIF